MRTAGALLRSPYFLGRDPRTLVGNLWKPGTLQWLPLPCLSPTRPARKPPGVSLRQGEISSRAKKGAAKRLPILLPPFVC